MEEIERMLIEHRCQKLILEYSALNDMGDWDGLAIMFTEDATFARPSAPEDVISGRENIRESFLSRKSGVTQHIVSNIIVTVESPTTAKASSVLQLFTGMQEVDGHVATHARTTPLIGRFEDRFRLVQGNWLFSERRGSLTMK